MPSVIESEQDQDARPGAMGVPGSARLGHSPRVPAHGKPTVAERAAPAGATPPPVDEQPAAAPSGAALVLQARALLHERFGPAAADVLDSLARMTRCERASLGLLHGGRMQVTASSIAGPPDAGYPLATILAAAMQEAVDQDEPIVHPPPPGSRPTLCFAHAELHRANGGLTTLTVPILGGERVVGALLLERREPFDAQANRLAEDAALFVGPVLELKHRVEAPIAGRLVEAVAPRGVRVGSHQRSPWRLAAGVGAALLLVAAVWPVTFRVVAQARVEGMAQRTVAAPLDGFIATAAARPGDTVRAGQLLGTLDDREPALQRDKLAAEIAQVEKHYREALAGDDAGEIIKTRAALESARAQHALAESELERTRLRAPFDGVLIQGDLGASLGSPVSRGQPLLTVAPAQGVKVVAEVADEDITVLRQGQQAQVLFAGLGQAPLRFTVERISPVAVTIDQRNVFEVEGRIDSHPSGATSPGLRGVARIDIDRRMQAEVWSVRVGHWLRRTLWQFMG